MDVTGESTFTTISQNQVRNGTKTFLERHFFSINSQV